MYRKSIFYFLLLLSFSFQASRAQWTPVNVDTTFLNTDVFFINADTGFVVGTFKYLPVSGENGIISRTFDGGITWDTTHLGAFISSIYFSSDSTGYCGGEDGAIYKTSDLGNYWTVLPHGIGQDYSNMHFFDNDSGFILTWGGDIQKTNNGGMSWILDTINTSIGFTPFPGIGSIQFVNDTTGIIGAGIYGTYARTFDRGLNWQKGSIDSNMNIVSIYMRNQWRGYAVGFDGKYSQTFDGGATWTVPVILSQYRLNDIAFFSDSVGYIVGGNFIPQITGSSKGIILKTIDAGNSWFVEDTSLPGWLTSIVAINNSAGYAVGWNGQILKTVNGAATGLTPDAQLSNNFIYPNPTRDFLNINYRNDILENSIFILYDVTGREVEKLPCSSQCSVNLSGYEQGLYFYEIVKSGKRKLTGKVSKIN